MPYKQEPCQAGRLQNEGRSIDQNNGRPDMKSRYINVVEKAEYEP